MRFTKGAKPSLCTVYTHVKTDWVNRDKAVLPDFARPEIPQNVAPIQKLHNAFYAIGTLDASTVFWTQTMSYLCTHTRKHTQADEIILYLLTKSYSFSE